MKELRDKIIAVRVKVTELQDDVTELDDVQLRNEHGALIALMDEAYEALTEAAGLCDNE